MLVIGGRNLNLWNLNHLIVFLFMLFFEILVRALRTTASLADIRSEISQIKSLIPAAQRSV